MMSRLNQRLLKGRLAEITSRVPFGARVLDVGCDHGYIPVHLAENKLANKIYASDLNPGPLAVAVKNATERGVADKISFYLADGIPSECAGEIDTVIIAGMGGETIIGILERAPETLNDGVFFILQPQSKQELLREYLDTHGFHGMTYTKINEGRRNYVIITCIRR